MEHLRTRWAALVVALLLLLSVAGVAGASGLVKIAGENPPAVQDQADDQGQDEDADEDQDEDTHRGRRHHRGPGHRGARRGRRGCPGRAWRDRLCRRPEPGVRRWPAQQPRLGREPGRHRSAGPRRRRVPRLGPTGDDQRRPTRPTQTPLRRPASRANTARARTRRQRRTGAGQASPDRPPYDQRRRARITRALSIRLAWCRATHPRPHRPPDRAALPPGRRGRAGHHVGHRALPGHQAADQGLLGVP